MRRLPATARLLGMGWAIAGFIVVGLVAGLWLDRKLGTAPLITLIGLGLGLGGAFFAVYRLVFEAVEEDKEDEERQGGNG